MLNDGHVHVGESDCFSVQEVEADSSGFEVCVALPYSSLTAQLETAYHLLLLNVAGGTSAPGLLGRDWRDVR